MDYNWLKVDLSRINFKDETFKLSTNANFETLISSIAQIGLINPPVLLSHEKQYVIVCGFSRIQACRQLGWTQLPARCLDAHTPRRQCTLLAITEAVSHRFLNVIEQARAMALLIRVFDTTQEAIEAAKAVGFAMNPKLAEKLSFVKSFGSQLQQGLMEDNIGLPVALRLYGMFNAGDSEDVSAFLRLLRLSLTRQKEVLDWIETILHRDGITLTDLLSDPLINQWRFDPQLDNPQRSKLIREHLRRRCYPTITAFEQHYAHTLKKIRMGQGVCFSPPPHFEGQNFSLRIDFSNYDECVHRINDVQQLVQSTAFRGLLDARIRPNE